jgi:hypothetical protein
VGARAQQGFGAQLRVTASPLPSPPLPPIQLQPTRTSFDLVAGHALAVWLLVSTAPMVVVSTLAGSGKTTQRGVFKTGLDSSHQSFRTYILGEG